jgi:hypothetical protein
MTLRPAVGVTGGQVAIIMEDDVAPYFMPMWTHSLADVVTAANSGGNWSAIQLHWLNQYDFEMPPPEALVGGLLERRNIWLASAAAYMISRRGMEKVLDRWFTGRGADSFVVPETEGGQLAIDCRYYGGDVFLNEHYLAWPAMFLTHESDAPEDDAHGYYAAHRRMNSKMWENWMTVHRRRYFKDMVYQEKLL